jgi:hypothetical protein
MSIFDIMWAGIVNIQDDYPDNEDRVWAAMEALANAGYVIVPREPTEAMREVGRRAIYGITRDDIDDKLVSERAAVAYQDMITIVAGDKP